MEFCELLCSQVSLFLPSVYAEDTLRLISRKRGADYREDIDKFEEECREHGVKVKVRCQLLYYVRKANN